MANQSDLSMVRRSSCIWHIFVCGWSPTSIVHHVSAKFKRIHSLPEPLSPMHPSSYRPLPKHAMYMKQSSTQRWNVHQEKNLFKNWDHLYSELGTINFSPSTLFSFAATRCSTNWVKRDHVPSIHMVHSVYQYGHFTTHMVLVIDTWNRSTQ